MKTRDEVGTCASCLAPILDGQAFWDVSFHKMRMEGWIGDVLYAEGVLVVCARCAPAFDFRGLRLPRLDRDGPEAFVDVPPFSDFDATPIMPPPPPEVLSREPQLPHPRDIKL